MEAARLLSFGGGERCEELISQTGISSRSELGPLDVRTKMNGQECWVAHD